MNVYTHKAGIITVYTHKAGIINVYTQGREGVSTHSGNPDLRRASRASAAALLLESMR